MNSYQIEVDEEVYSFLKDKAEPFLDTPNDVLRRVLLGKPRVSHHGESAPRTSECNLPPIPGGTPMALEQILQVLYLIRNCNYSRGDATKSVANQHNVAPQTVLDKYCRQLNITAAEFDKFLDQPALHDLKNLLFRKFRLYSDLIDNYLSQ